MVPAWDDFLDPEDAAEGVLVAVPVAGAVPVDSGASAHSICQHVRVRRWIGTHSYLLPLQ
jgi:hypothetical protein